MSETTWRRTEQGVRFPLFNELQPCAETQHDQSFQASSSVVLMGNCLRPRNRRSFTFETLIERKSKTCCKSSSQVRALSTSLVYLLSSQLVPFSSDLEQDHL